MIFARFTIAYWCILFAAILPIVCAGIAKYGMFNIHPKQGGYDNNNPRAWLAKQSDWRARANAAQANTFEALPFFFVLPAYQGIKKPASVSSRAGLYRKIGSYLRMLTLDQR